MSSCYHRMLQKCEREKPHSGESNQHTLGWLAGCMGFVWVHADSFLHSLAPPLQSFVTISMHPHKHHATSLPLVHTRTDSAQTHCTTSTATKSTQSTQFPWQPELRKTLQTHAQPRYPLPQAQAVPAPPRCRPSAGILPRLLAGQGHCSEAPPPIGSCRQRQAV